MDDLRPAHPWINGPAFLYEEEDNWPKSEHIPALDEENEEIRKSAVIQVTHKFVPLLDMARFSSWKKIVRVFVYITRFVDACKKRRTFVNEIPSPTVDEFEAAELKAIAKCKKNVSMQTFYH